jgi:hypothetical protein
VAGPLRRADRSGGYREDMTIATAHDSALDERTRKAWSAYRDELAELQGRAYDEAETASWDHLQETLRDIENDRAALHTGGEDDD